VASAVRFIREQACRGIKRLVVARRVVFTEKAETEMVVDDLSPEREAPIVEPFSCAECGRQEMITVTETCRLADGLSVKRLRHYKCRSCGARLFDDDAMHRIQEQRATHPGVAVR
jgi:DNA-directed RNA polymerase subunit M/transcription elongation factor TFIIS